MTGHGDWVVAALSLASCWLMGSKRRAAWALAIVANVAGMAYFAAHGLDGLVALEAVFVALNLRGWWSWAPDAVRRPTLDELLADYRITDHQEGNRP